jgi:hypothetical protein
MNIIEMNKFLNSKGLTVFVCIKILRSLNFNVFFGHFSTITAIFSLKIFNTEKTSIVSIKFKIFYLSNKSMNQIKI